MEITEHYTEDPLAVALITALDVAEKRRDELSAQLETGDNKSISEQVEKSNSYYVKILSLLTEIYTLDIVNVYLWQHCGYRSPRFYRNPTGVEDTEGVRNTIAEMALARGQILADE